MLVLVRAGRALRARQHCAFVGMGNLGRLGDDVDQLAVFGTGCVVGARRVRDLQQGRGEQSQCE